MLREPPSKGPIIYTNPNAKITIYSGFLQRTIPVAIKEQVHTTLEDANASISEAMIQGQLDHPNVCKMYGCYLQSEKEGGVKSVIVVELLEGDLMKQITKRIETGSYWSEDDLLWMLYNLSLALSYSQSKGISHRDIKPQNIFLSSSNQVKLGDFGSSAVYHNPDALDVTLQGTPFFLSPELRVKLVEGMQMIDSKRNYDPYKSDVYSLGVTMVFTSSLLVPTSLFYPGDPEGVEGALAALGSYERLKPILRKMLAASPADRPSFSDIELLCSQAFMPVTHASVPQSVVVKVPTEHWWWSRPKSEVKETCCVCRKEVIDPGWRQTVPSNLAFLWEHFSHFCSILCLEKYSEALNGASFLRGVCCGEIITIGNLKLFEALLLPCGHAFHANCFRVFLNEKARYINCPSCNSLISDSQIDLFTRPGFARELNATKDRIFCSICGVNYANTSFGGCGHNICSNCDFNSIQRLFRRRCRVCFELKRIAK